MYAADNNSSKRQTEQEIATHCCMKGNATNKCRRWTVFLLSPVAAVGVSKLVGICCTYPYRACYLVLVRIIDHRDLIILARSAAWLRAAHCESRKYFLKAMSNPRCKYQVPGMPEPRRGQQQPDQAADNSTSPMRRVLRAVFRMAY